MVLEISHTQWFFQQLKLTCMEACVVQYHTQYFSLEIVIHPAAHSVCLESQVHILAVSMVDVILVEDVIQTLVEVFQVKENDSTSSLHANLDLVNVATNLIERMDYYFQNIAHHTNLLECTLYP